MGSSRRSACGCPRPGGHASAAPHCTGASPWPEGWPPRIPPRFSPRPRPCDAASRSDRGGRREAAWAPRGRLFTPGLTRPLWDSQGCRSKGPQSGRGAADSRGSFSRSGGWERGLQDQVLPRRGPAVPPPAEGGAGGPGSARLWLRDGHPCLHRRVASLPLGKVSVLRPPPLRRTRSPGEGPSHLQRPPFQKTLPAWAPGVKT